MRGVLSEGKQREFEAAMAQLHPLDEAPDVRKMKDKPQDERPRERLKMQGATALTDHELVAILLRTGVKECNVFELARRFCHLFHPITKLRALTYEDMKGWIDRYNDYLRQRDPETLSPQEREIKGIGEDKLITLLAALELGARVYAPKGEPLRKPILRPSDIADIMLTEASRFTREGFWAIYVDRHRRMIQDKPDLVTLGIRSTTLIEPAVLFRRAVMLDAHGLYIVHNHPGGDVRPSDEDIATTQRLVTAGYALGIVVHDHIIIGRPEVTPHFYSLRANDDCTF